MDAKTAIDVILHNATGRRASGRELLVSEKRSILDESAGSVLKGQWKSAGRDHAQVVMMLTDHEGANPHFVTGWDGRDKFVCMTEQGLCYVDYRKLEKMKVHEGWNPQTRLVEIRAHMITEDYEMSGSEVDQLVSKIKRTLKKSNKKRRKGRLRNMEKFFDFAVVESHGPESETEFERIKEKDDRIPEEPKEPSSSKLPKDAKGKQTHRESFNWRRGWTPRHPMMTENSCDPQLDKREHVRMDSEGKGGGTGATPGGNKTDPQKEKRELVDMRHEDKAMGAKDGSDKSDDCDHMTYAGEKVKNNEMSARPKIAVRHEAMGDKKAQKFFGPKSRKKMPKKGGLMIILALGKGKPPKKAMSEAERAHTCTNCGGSFNRPFWKPQGAYDDRTCPQCESNRKKSGGRLGLRAGINKPPKGFFGSDRPSSSGPKSTFESRYSRASLNLVEGKKGRVPEAFLPNIQKMKAKAKKRRGRDLDCR